MISHPRNRRPGSLRILCECAPDYGVTAEQCLSGTGLKLADLYDSGNKITITQEFAAIANFLNLTETRHGIGIEIGRRIKPEVLGIWGYALLTSPTPRVSITTAIKYYELSFLIAPMDLQEVGDEGHLIFDVSSLPSQIRKFILERHLTVLLNFTSTMIPQMMAEPVIFRTTEYTPDFAATLEAELGLTVVPDADTNTVVMPRKLLDEPLPQHNPEVLAVCLKQCENLQSQIAQNSWSARTHDAILAELHGSPTLQSIAQTLDTSERTLTRRLAEEKTTFRTLLLRARLAVAHELLTTTTLSVSNIAWRAGYAEPSSFIRAFKKEYGTAPGQLARTSPKQ
ncbi:AraC family transcriptional regulator [Thalassovita mediterranea]|jgi:AraC-like DNA-binding protein|uniref:HTH-type transcriptional regulator GadW n=1 Tax=Thalassovita mediterranea TaxID=340021 RepID=A0A0P1GPP7_9RHOB|nr:AraC family transcriptional regulator [Thalassovita mediterranea]CUH84420.1 HTH-type transcriptional regulator GadW [Thalassovita mediterranea]SIS34197.1 AraC-type DNA-binding protein [Thalassovita mediterranea]